MIRELCFAMLLVLSAVAIVPCAAPASTLGDAVIRETVTIADLLASQGTGAASIPSVDTLDDPDNVTITHTMTGGYYASTVFISGTIRGDNAESNWYRDARIEIVPPGGEEFTVMTSLSTLVGAVGDTRTYMRTITPTLPRTGIGWGQNIQPGEATFQFYELNDEASGSADNTHLDIEILFIDDAANNGEFPLGTLTDGSTYFNDTHSHVPGGIDFFSFTLPTAGRVELFTDESENGPFGFDITDTEIGLFDGNGALIAQNDTRPIDEYSELNLDLAAGDYTLVTTTYNSNLNNTISIGDDISLVQGGQYDGDYAFSLSFTESETGGGLVCDFDSDSDCDPTDLSALYANFGTANATFDVDGSGSVDGADITPWLVAASSAANPFNTGGLTFQLGDANFDGAVDSTDLGLLLNNFGNTTGMGYGAGNLNDDPNVDSTDLGLMLNNFGFASAVAVPEPAARAWGGLLLLLTLLWRRR